VEAHAPEPRAPSPRAGVVEKLLFSKKVEGGRQELPHLRNPIPSPKLVYPSWRNLTQATRKTFFCRSRCNRLSRAAPSIPKRPQPKRKSAEIINYYLSLKPVSANRPQQHGRPASNGPATLSTCECISPGHEGFRLPRLLTVDQKPECDLSATARPRSSGYPVYSPKPYSSLAHTAPLRWR